MLELHAQGRAGDELMSLAIGPFKVMNHYSIFMVNGFRFHTNARAMGKKTQNNGVLVRGDCSDAEKEYYGELQDIYELSYLGNRKVYLFKCHWWDMAHKGTGYKIDKFGFTYINIHHSLATNEPFFFGISSTSGILC